MFFSLDQQPYSLQLHPSDSQVYIEFAVFLNTTSKSTTAVYEALLEIHWWISVRSTNLYSALEELQSTKFNWLIFQNFKTEVLLRRVWKTLFKNTYFKRWLHYHLPLFASLYPYDLVPSFLLFLFFFGLHTHSILNVTLMQVPCTSMFLKIQTQVFKHMLHHPIHL